MEKKKKLCYMAVEALSLNWVLVCAGRGVWVCRCSFDSDLSGLKRSLECDWRTLQAQADSLVQQVCVSRCVRLNLLFPRLIPRLNA